MAIRTCTQCGNCVDQCPVYALLRQEQASPKGKHVILGATEEKLFTWKQSLDLTRLCAGCERCAAVCPANLSVPDALAKAREQHPDWVRSAWKLWVTHGSLLWPVASCSARLLPQFLQRLLLPGQSAVLARSAAAMAAPKVPAPWLHFEKLSSPEVGTATTGTALLFSGCTAGNVRPDWTERARRLLLASGYTLADAQAFTCCGSTLHHAGLSEPARLARQKNLEVWERAGRPPLFTFCASCHHALESYAEDLPPSEAEAWKTALRPLSHLLLDKAPRPTEEAPAQLAYHQPCHRTGEDTDQALLRAAFPGISKGSTLCCGMGGVLKLSHAQLSQRLAEQCWEGLVLQENSMDSVVSGCSGCVLQLASTAPQGIQVRHWLDIVAIPGK